MMSRPVGRRLIKGKSLLQKAFKNEMSKDSLLKSRSVDTTDFSRTKAPIVRSVVIALQTAFLFMIKSNTSINLN